MDELSVRMAEIDRAAKFKSELDDRVAAYIASREAGDASGCEVAACRIVEQVLEASNAEPGSVMSMNGKSTLQESFGSEEREYRMSMRPSE